MSLFPERGLEGLPEACAVVAQCGWFPGGCQTECPRFKHWQAIRRQAHWPPTHYQTQHVPLTEKYPSATAWAHATWEDVPVTLVTGPKRGEFLTTLTTLWAGLAIRQKKPWTVETLEWPDSSQETPALRIWMLPPGLVFPTVPKGAQHTVIVSGESGDWTPPIGDRFVAGDTVIWDRAQWGVWTTQASWDWMTDSWGIARQDTVLEGATTK
jgi:hypothetical protein